MNAKEISLRAVESGAEQAWMDAFLIAISEGEEQESAAAFADDYVKNQAPAEDA